jgi:DNA repair ATPase RecN
VNENDDGVSKADLLKMVSRLSALAAIAETKVEAAVKAAQESNTSMTYWLGELNKSQARVKELERQVEALSSPLAELARAAKETP